MVVVVNSNSPNSLQLGNYYCEKRGVPPQNVLRINWTGGNKEWTKDELNTVLRGPLNAMLASRQLTNQVDYVLLSMDIPYFVSTITDGYNGATSTLFYGFKPDTRSLDTCPVAPGSASLYAASEAIFRQKPPVSATSNSWLAVMLTSSNLAQAKALVDRGCASDGTFPTQTVYLAKSFDVNRNIRYLNFDDAVFNTRLRGNYSMQSTNISSNYGLGTMLGFQIGRQQFTVYGDFVPGAIADNLTSYSGDLFGSPDHTRVLEFINAGATASYGTVAEPCPYLEKFASPQIYFYQARGFSIAECYYQSVTNPYQGILVGEPLAAPFARPCDGGWSNLPAGVVLSSTTNLTLHFSAADVERPVQQVDLFLDGTFVQTLTNIAPARFNVLYVTLPGKTNLSYTVQLNETLATVASGVYNVLNNGGNKTVTKVSPFLHGDRLELQSTDANRTGADTFISVSNYIGTASGLTTHLHVSQPNFLDTIAYGMRRISVGGAVVVGDFLQLTATKTNGAIELVSVTNTTLGLTLSQFVQQFMDAINTNSNLQGGDGLLAEDLAPSRTLANTMEFNLRARSQGVEAADMQMLVAGSFVITPVGTQTLKANLADLQPRNHLYVTAGATNVPLTFAFNTTTRPDGWHELTAVAYEGSHVRTQRRVSQNVRIQNTTLSATFSCSPCDTNTAVEATLQFGVTANTNTVVRTELFSTGGSWGAVSNQPAASFSLAGTNLGVGQHPFYALVTRNDGKQYRTETKWIRLVGSESPFSVAVAAGAPTLSWPAVAGRRYEVLSTTNVANTFLLRDAITPTNSPGQWAETNNAAAGRFYRVRSVP